MLLCSQQGGDPSQERNEVFEVYFCSLTAGPYIFCGIRNLESYLCYAIGSLYAVVNIH